MWKGNIGRLPPVPQLGTENTTLGMYPDEEFNWPLFDTQEDTHQLSYSWQSFKTIFLLSNPSICVILLGLGFHFQLAFLRLWSRVSSILDLTCIYPSQCLVLVLASGAGHSLVLKPLENDRSYSQVHACSAQGWTQEITHSFISFHELPPFCDLTFFVVVPKDTTFLVV